MTDSQNPTGNPTNTSLAEKMKQQQQLSQRQPQTPTTKAPEPKTEAAKAKESMVENPLKPSIPPVEHEAMGGTEATPQADPKVHSGAAQAQPATPVNQTSTSFNEGKPTKKQAEAIREQEAKKEKEAPSEYPVGGRG